MYHYLFKKIHVNWTSLFKSFSTSNCVPVWAPSRSSVGKGLKPVKPWWRHICFPVPQLAQPKTTHPWKSSNLCHFFSSPVENLLEVKNTSKSVSSSAWSMVWRGIGRHLKSQRLIIHGFVCQPCGHTAYIYRIYNVYRMLHAIDCVYTIYIYVDIILIK